MLKRIAKILSIFLIIFIFVGLITYLVVSLWDEKNGEVVAILVAIFASVLAILKDLIAIIKDTLEIQGMEKNNTQTLSGNAKNSESEQRSVNPNINSGLKNPEGLTFPPLSTIRNILTAKFDDPELDAFCQDNFFHVYKKFGRGMRKDEKINTLLDYCNRDKSNMSKLLKAIDWNNS